MRADAPRLYRVVQEITTTYADGREPHRVTYVHGPYAHSAYPKTVAKGLTYSRDWWYGTGTETSVATVEATLADWLPLC
jgi:hypothetical protein